MAKTARKKAKAVSNEDPLLASPSPQPLMAGLLSELKRTFPVSLRGLAANRSEGEENQTPLQSALSAVPKLIKERFASARGGRDSTSGDSDWAADEVHNGMIC
jgi:hypothetical protein